MCSILLWSLIAVAFVDCAQAFQFNDPALENAIAIELDRQGLDMEEEHLSQLEKLTAIGAGIIDLSGIEALTSLHTLILPENSLEDLSPLANLRELHSLDLGNNQIADLSPLASLDRLTLLNLDFNRVVDLSPLANARALVVLSAMGNVIEELAPIVGLNDLEEVDIRANPLGLKALNEQIPALMALNVKVFYDPVDEGSTPAEDLSIPGTWTHLGPFLGEEEIGVYSLSISPSNPEIMYSATPNGIWRSENGGEHWAATQLMTEPELIFALLTVGIDAGDANRIYWFEGGFSELDVLRSDDGGQRWKRMISPVYESCSGSFPPSPILSIDPVRPGRLYGLNCRKLVVSEDGGETWSEKTQTSGAPVLLEGNTVFLHAHPRDGQNVYAGFYLFRSGRTYLTWSNDGGETWTERALMELELIAITPDPRDVDHLYGLGDGALFHSEDRGQTWDFVSAIPSSGANQLTVSPLNPDLIFAWTHLTLVEDQRSTWRSADGGKTWQRIDLEHISQLLLHPEDPQRLFAVTSNPVSSGAIYRSDNGGRTWQRLPIISENRAVRTLQVASSGEILAGTGRFIEDRYEPSLLYSQDAGETWEERIEEINTHQIDMNLNFPYEIGLGTIDRLHLVDGRTDEIMAHARAWFLHSQDGGHAWDLIDLGPRIWLTSGGQPGMATLREAGILYYFLADPQDVKRLLFRRTVDETNWTSINSQINTILVDSQKCVFTARNGFVWMSADRGTNWDLAGKLPGSSGAHLLAVDPNGTDQLYAVNAFGLYTSDDGGAFWENLLERPEDQRWDDVRLTVGPGQPDILYLAAGRSLWESRDRGETWNEVGRGSIGLPWFSDVAVSSENPSQVYVATPKGLYQWNRRDESTAIRETGTAPLAFALHQNYPNPFNASTTILYQMPQAGEAVLSVFNIAGQKVRRLDTGHHEDGMHSITWDGRDQSGNRMTSGVYFYRLQIDQRIETRKMVRIQ